MAAPVKFENPPVAEVVCGVVYNSLPLKTPHVGLFWESLRKQFPRIEEMPPVDVVEAVGPNPTNAPFQVQVEFMSIPPLRRTWLINETGSHLIQIQQDRFIFNWKRVKEEKAYPSYNVVIAQFEKRLDEYNAFLRKEKIEPQTFQQFELSYINVIRNANGLKDVGPRGVMVDHLPAATKDRFLPEPEGFNWLTGYTLPDGWARLRVTAASAIDRDTHEQVIKLDLSVKGAPQPADRKNLRAWFDKAHEWITFGFADLTAPALHKIWKRTS